MQHYCGPVPQPAQHVCIPIGDEKIEAKHAMGKAKLEAIETGGRPGNVLANNISNLSDAVLIELPRTDSAKRIIRRAKRSFMPPEPKELSELQYEGIL
jgi:hypothetical protein